MIKKALLILLILNASLHADFYYSNGKKHELKAEKNIRAATENSLILFKTNFGTTVGVDNRLIVSFKDINIKKIIEQKYNLTLIKSLNDSLFLYKIEDMKKTIEISNKIYEEEGVKFAHPDFHREKRARVLTNDPHADLLWHLEDNEGTADINIKEAWKWTKGAGVKVAVYDEGIDIDHIDLKDNIYKFANFNNDNISSLPYSDDDSWHGTACAGLLASSENGKGGVGTAPEINLYAVRYSDTSVSKDIEAYEWMMSEGVSVITNSWGTYQNLDAYNETFEKLATQGRDGKGIIIIFAAGNNGQDLDDVNENGASINDESESPYVLSIAASTRDNTIASYSNYGSAVDLTAPGGSQNGDGLFTTDASGVKGYTADNYNYNFVGTSASAPIAAGVVALMLSVNPELDRDNITDILKQTAQKLGNFAYDENGHNNHWGYGKIDAGHAVRIARTYGKSKLKSFTRTMFAELF